MNPELNHLVSKQHIADVRLEADRRRLAKQAVPVRRSILERTSLAPLLARFAIPHQQKLS